MRLFLAIPLPAKVKDHLQQWIKAHFVQEEKGIRWMPYENWHITVCFIGETQMSSEEIKDRVKPVVKSFQSFSLEFQKFQPFPEKHHRMIWGRYQSSKPFEELYDRVNRLFFSEEEVRQQPIPHITLARLKKAKPLRKEGVVSAKTAEELSFEVDRMMLWKSKRHKYGAEYEVLWETYFGK